MLSAASATFAQNLGARLIFIAWKSCHITLFTQELDWLPVNEGIQEKILKNNF